MKRSSEWQVTIRNRAVAANWGAHPGPDPLLSHPVSTGRESSATHSLHEPG